MPIKSFMASRPLGFLLTKIPCFWWRPRSFKALMTQFFSYLFQRNLCSYRQQHITSCVPVYSSLQKVIQRAIYTLELLLPAGRPICTPIAPSKNTNGDSWSPALAMHLHFDIFCCSHGYLAACIAGKLILSELHKVLISLNTGLID